MIFLGDLVCPDEKIDNLIDCIASQSVFDNEIVVVNLEAIILDKDENKKPSTLWNSERIVSVFPKAKKVIVSLANNHMNDYPANILNTKCILEQNGIGVFGLEEPDGRIIPFEYKDENGITHAFFGHCWNLYTKTNTNTENSIHVVDCDYDRFVKIVEAYSIKNPHNRIYCFMHWNYDMEKLPFPMHRKLAMRLIDVGVEAVIGSHSHRPQGVEFYKGKIIAYCLGNFYLPSNYYFGGHLTYPDCSHETYGVIIGPETPKLVWFDTDKQNVPIEAKSTESVDNGEKILSISRFRNMGHKTYKHVFKKNREKSFLVPVFEYYSGFRYNFFLNIAIFRVKLIRVIKRVFEK